MSHISMGQDSCNTNTEEVADSKPKNQQVTEKLNCHKAYYSLGSIGPWFLQTILSTSVTGFSSHSKPKTVC